MRSITPTRTPTRAGCLALAAMIAALMAAFGPAHAQTKGGPASSPPAAAVYFIGIKDGDTLPTKSTIHFGLRNMSVAPAGIDRPNTGHHHLIIDAPLPPLDQPIPNDFNHLHFGAGQTEAQVTLTPGKHTLQLLLGDKDHVPHTPPVHSDRITVNVVDQARSASATRRYTSPPDAQVYFENLRDGQRIPPRMIIRFGLLNMGVAPAGADKPNTGHHHLIIDAPPPSPDRPIPNDFNHLHFGTGQTEGEVTLTPGRHTLQLVLGDRDHVPHDPPVMSKPITVIVTDSDQADEETSDAQKELARQLQAALDRVGCDPGPVDGDWGAKSRAALELFNRHATASLNTDEATSEALDAVSGKTTRVCPLVCGRGMKVEDDTCVAIREPPSRRERETKRERESKPAPAPKRKSAVSREPPRRRDRARATRATRQREARPARSGFSNPNCQSPIFQGGRRCCTYDPPGGAPRIICP